MSFSVFLNVADLPAKWRFWPFNSGFGGDWETTLATALLTALILGAICLFLRKLYGPGGIWRDKEMEKEAEEARRRDLIELEKRLSAGEISQEEYEWKKRELLR